MFPDHLPNSNPFAAASTLKPFRGAAMEVSDKEDGD